MIDTLRVVLAVALPILALVLAHHRGYQQGRHRGQLEGRIEMQEQLTAEPLPPVGLRLESKYCMHGEPIEGSRDQCPDGPETMPLTPVYEGRDDAQMARWAAYIDAQTMNDLRAGVWRVRVDEVPARTTIDVRGRVS